MSNFETLRTHFSVADRGATELTLDQFRHLNRNSATNIISHVEDFRIQSQLQKIYDADTISGETLLLLYWFLGRSFTSTLLDDFLDLFDCIMTQNGLTRTGRIYNLTGSMGWQDERPLMYVRDSWISMAQILASTKYVILEGKAGRGKSLFAMFFIFEVLLCAKNNTVSAVIPDLQPATDIVIGYIDRSGLRYRLTKDTAVRCTGHDLFESRVTYCISDNVDIKARSGVGSALTMAITSGDPSVLQEFRKRVTAIPETMKATITMPSLTSAEMQQVFPDMGLETLQFRFDVAGGNPRVFNNSPSGTTHEEYSSVVQEAVRELFGVEYVPSPAAQQTQQQQFGKWAMKLVVGALVATLAARVSGSIPSTDSSLFKEYIVTADFLDRTEQFSSVFLGLVAAKLQQVGEGKLTAALTTLFGASGMGNAFEFTSHIALENIGAQQICWCPGAATRTKFIKLALGNKVKVLIRGVADVGQLQAGDRGVPTICNFPFVDEVIPPNIGVRITTGLTQIVTDTSASILQGLGITAEQFTVVFVVPRENLPHFQFPDLGQIRVCATIPEAITVTAFQALCKKRKRGD
jgi:hypothetical protein